VYLNCGSAVVLPEVFLKAVALARNRGVSLEGLTTVNLDFVKHYRPQTNVVSRPTAGIGRGYTLVGHHELTIPLLAAARARSAAARPVQRNPARTTRPCPHGSPRRNPHGRPVHVRTDPPVGIRTDDPSMSARTARRRPHGPAPRQTRPRVV
jgi:hypothetical protein